MKKLLYKLWSKFLTIFGDIKYFKWPLWLVYDPTAYAVAGYKIAEILSILKPGDIVLRGYEHYLDGVFIPDKLKYSHGAIYVGNGKIIHAIAKGVSEIDAIDFCLCDRIAIFRPKKGQKTAINEAKKYLKSQTPYDFGFSKGVSALYCFELCGECYKKLNIPRYTVKKFFGLIKKENVFLAESFFKSKDMSCVFQYNPRFNIDFKK